MQSMWADLQQLFFDAVAEVYPDFLTKVGIIEISSPHNDKFGHYQCNTAMKLAKPLQQPPRLVAETIIKHLQKLPRFAEMIESSDIAGPGFINLVLKTEYLNQRVNEMLISPTLGVETAPHHQKIIIDFSGPNIAKEMHVGHLRSTIIGDCLCRLYEFLGYNVLRLNHLGDWGTAFGMLIAHMKETAPDVLTGQSDSDLSHLVQWYRESKKKFDENLEFKKRAQLEVVALQSGDSQNLKAWEILCRISRVAYQEIYDLLDIKIIDRGESFYNPYLKSLVNDLTAQDLIVESDGAKCMFLEGFKNRDGEALPLILQKSDGGFNYATTDFAALKHRLEEEKADRIMYVHDLGQSTHFAMVFKAAEVAKILDPKKVRVDFVGFGLVLGPDGKRFRTRSGETARLIDLLYAAIEHAKKVLLERNTGMMAQQIDHTALVLGIDAIKYADLSSNRTHDYVFSYDKMLKLEGNTAAFLMYSYVRIAGIKRKCLVNVHDLIGRSTIQLIHPSEIDLALHVCRFNEVLDQIVQDSLPNHLTDYLYTLAEKFNIFFRDCRVGGSPEQTSRLLLCELTAKIMQQGFAILGLKLVERM